MPRRHTSIQDLQSQEKALQNRISADLQELLVCQERLVEAAKAFEDEYSKKGDRHPISVFVSHLRRNLHETRISYARVAQMRLASYEVLSDTLREQERREDQRRDRKARRKSDAQQQ